MRSGSDVIVAAMAWCGGVGRLHCSSVEQHVKSVLFLSCQMGTVAWSPYVMKISKRDGQLHAASSLNILSQLHIKHIGS